MLSGKGNKKGDKTTIGLISEKATLHVQHPFFVHFFAVVFHDYNVKLPETSWLCILWRKCRMCSCSLLFSLSLIYTLVATAFLIFSPPLQNFMLFLPKKMSPLFFLSRSSFFLIGHCWPVAFILSLFLCLCLSLFSKIVHMTI